MNEAIPLHNLSSEDGSERILDAVWGTPRLVTEPDLKWYLRYCEDEKSFVMRRTPHLLQGASLPTLIQHLKTNVDQTKRQLVLAHSGTSDDGTFQSALELAVRLVFLTACISLSEETFGGDLFRPRWHEAESLTSYIDRVYPRVQPPSLDATPIRVDKLAVGYLTSYARLHLIWTHRLTDHLMLVKRSNRKSLRIFRHPAFLKISLQMLDRNGKGLETSSAAALSIGCLPPSLLKETLATLSLLFPDPSSDLSQTILEKEVIKHGLDETFLRPLPTHYGEHQQPQDALDPEDVRGLYLKYPYWADRLYALWKEADDPAPITLIERWSESRRNPRFTYWCTVVSITIAILFGMVATGLSAVQSLILDWTKLAAGHPDTPTSMNNLTLT
ncbi:hypothetical protein GQ53DRAFT_817499 [Thozetella sp. PMI_491]|nr:hypothetical protein GQ53DRAFT_817499 [Thozetella sp. PMI_491]